MAVPLSFLFFSLPVKILSHFTAEELQRDTAQKFTTPALQAIAQASGASLDEVEDLLHTHAAALTDRSRRSKNTPPVSPLPTAYPPIHLPAHLYATDLSLSVYLPLSLVPLSLCLALYPSLSLALSGCLPAHVGEFLLLRCPILHESVRSLCVSLSRCA